MRAAFASTKMLKRVLLLASATAAAIRSVAASASGYEVKNVVRSIELGGSISSISTAYTLTKPAEDLGEPFYAAFSDAEWRALSTFGLSIDTPSTLRDTVLTYTDAGTDAVDNSTHLLAIDLSSLSLSPEQDLTFTIKGVFTHFTFPLPRTAPHDSTHQYLAWKGDTGIRSAYPVRKGRTKITYVARSYLFRPCALHC